ELGPDAEAEETQHRYPEYGVEGELRSDLLQHLRVIQVEVRSAAVGRRVSLPRGVLAGPAVVRGRFNSGVADVRGERGRAPAQVGCWTRFPWSSIVVARPGSAPRWVRSPARRMLWGRVP